MNANKNIILSVIIPVYNAEQYLSECLKSIYQNNDKYLKKYEVIIIDDGSTDESFRVYKSYANKYKNITIIKTKNSGVSHARNLGIATARGDYIMFVDSDDILMPKWIKIIEDIKIKNNPDIIFYSQYFKSKNQVAKKDLYSYVFTYNKDNIRISGPYSKLFKKSFIQKNNILFEEDIINGEDMLFNLYAIKHSTTYSLMSKSFYIVRHNSDSSTSNYDSRIIESEKRFNQYISDFIINTDNNLEIYKDIMLSNTIRTVCYRISTIKKYTKAKKEYLKLKSNFHKKYKINNIYCLLFKYKMYFALYCLCKYKKQNKERYEVL